VIEKLARACRVRDGRSGGRTPLLDGQDHLVTDPHSLLICLEADFPEFLDRAFDFIDPFLHQPLQLALRQGDADESFRIAVFDVVKHHLGNVPEPA
jgi:hypothetical protein